jgi:16S rRNA (guanine527-N7)-methyltransferase
MKSLQKEVQELIGIALSAQQLSQLEVYQQELKEWNDRYNLTAIHDPEKIRIKHFLDSFSSFLVLRSTSISNLIDIGTGAGFPGIPLKILLPDTDVVLVDSINKKTEFCQHIIDRLELKGIQVIQNRVERLARDELYRERFDWAVARAVAQLSTLSEYLLPFVKIGGRMLAMKGDQGPIEAHQAHNAFSILGGELSNMVKITLPGVTEDRYLITVEKTAKTPDKYPRRVGVPNKKPL